jgi:hypothetical protein
VPSVLETGLTGAIVSAAPARSRRRSRDPKSSSTGTSMLTWTGRRTKGTTWRHSPSHSPSARPLPAWRPTSRPRRSAPSATFFLEETSQVRRETSNVRPETSHDPQEVVKVPQEVGQVLQETTIGIHDWTTSIQRDSSLSRWCYLTARQTTGPL